MSCYFAKYANVFGEPSTGVHSYRVFNIAIIDLLIAIVFAYFVSKYYNYDFIKVLILVLLVGIILHRIFCVRTTVDRLLFN
jgi:hypothetical protein